MATLRSRKWTAAHEVGHLLSGHITDPPMLLTQRQEREADDFAAELLAPLTVLHFCGVSSATEIEKLCGISRQAAEFRFQELSRLRRAQDEVYRLGVRNEQFSPDCIFLKNRRTARTFLKIRAVHRELYSIKIPPRRLRETSHSALAAAYGNKLLIKAEVHRYSVAEFKLRLALDQRQEIIQRVYGHVVSSGFIHSRGNFFSWFAIFEMSAVTISTR